MASPSLRSGLRRWCLLLVGATVGAQTPPAPLTIPDDTASPRWNWSMAPRSFQKNPLLDFNVSTELTGEGRKRPLPTAAQPVTYVVQPGKFIALGDGFTPKQIPPVEKLQEIMLRALAVNHYVLAKDDGPTPDLVIVFTFGAHTVDEEDPLDELERAAADAEAVAAGQDPAAPTTGGPRGAEELLGRALADLPFRRNVLERAALVGGTAFANELGAVIAEEVTRANATAGLGLANGLGPFQRFLERDSRTRHLVEEAFSSCYFVIATAYDYASVARNDRIPLWRTRMTVNSAGVNLGESLPPLIAAAAPFFGREMPHPAVITRRIDRSGTVTIGEATVIGITAPPTDPDSPIGSGPAGKR